MDQLRDTRTLALAAAGVGSALLITAIALINAYVPTSVLKDAVLAVMSGILAVFIVSVVWDVVLRERWTEEFLRTVNLQRTLKLAGIEDIALEHEVPWRQFLSNMDEFHFVVRNLDFWNQTRLPQLLNVAGASRPIELHVYIPDPQHVTAGLYEGIGAAAYEEARARLDEAWAAAAGSNRLHAASRLNKWALSHPPQFMIAGARSAHKRRTILVLWPSRPAGASGVAFRFEATREGGGEVAQWVEDQLAPLREESNRVQL